ncbi:MAG: hypothetical protein SLRJCFUN_001908 [Candidatus Fervidibacter sp.]
MKDEDILLVGLTEEEKRALEEIWQLAEAGDIAEAVRKASETFQDEQGIAVVLRVGIVTPATGKGQPFEEVCERVREAIDNLENPQQRRRFEIALQEYRRTVEELKQAVRAVAGVWADHPEFEGKGVREWRRTLWDSRKEA